MKPVATDNMDAMKLGFIVEGTADKQIVEALARRLLPVGVKFHTVRLGGIVAIPTAYTTVLLMRSKGYDHVTLVFDADSSIPASVATKKRYVEAPLAEHHVSDVTTVCPAVPQIEGWILAGLADEQYPVLDPKSSIQRLSQGQPPGAEAIGGLLERMDLDLAAQREPSFAEFASHLRSLAGAEAGANA